MVTFTILTDIFAARILKLVTGSSAFFYFGAFLVATNCLPSQLLNHSAFRVGVGPWILLSSILSNVYVSLLLRGFNAPPEPTRFTSWQNLIPRNQSTLSYHEKYKLTGKHLRRLYMENNHVLNLTDFEGFSILSSASEDIFYVAIDRLMDHHWFAGFKHFMANWMILSPQMSFIII